MSLTAGQLASFSLASQVGGALASTVGSFIGAKGDKATLRAQAAVADANARIAELGAQSALQQGQQQVGALTLQAGQLKARQRTALAANGIDLGEGSASEIQASSDLFKEIDADTLTANAVRSAFGFRTQAVNFQTEALTKRATASAISPFGAAATTLLGGAGRVADSFARFKKTGIFDDPKPKR